MIRNTDFCCISTPPFLPSFFEIYTRYRILAMSWFNRGPQTHRRGTRLQFLGPTACQLQLANIHQTCDLLPEHASTSFSAP